MQLRLAHATIFRAFKILTLALFAYVITAIVVHPPLLETLKATFYGLIVLAIIAGLLMNVLNIDPIQALVVTAIINGVVARPILVLIALLARDGEVMGDRRSGRWSNGLVWAAALLMGAAAIALLATLL
jgi:Mn2+/Fe2+ NRAMP family transporter